MPTIIELGQKVKNKYPQYADMSDAEVGKKVKAKYPSEYADFTDTTDTSIKQEAPKKDLLQKTTDVVNSILPGKQVGGAIGTLGGLALEKVKELFGGKDNSKYYDTSAPSPLQVGGDILKGAALVGGLKAPIPKSFLGQAGQFGALSGGTALGQGLVDKKGAGEIVKETAKATAIGGVLGGGFNLFGRGVSALAKKTAPTTLSFTSGVPKKAIEKAIESPLSTKFGRTSINVTELQTKAVQALKNPKNGLYKNLSDEFSSGLDEVTQKYGFGGKLGSTPKPAGFKYPGGGVNLPAFNKAGAMATKGNVTTAMPKIENQVKSLINDFRLTSKKGVIDFSTSSIIKNAEQTNIQEAFNTVKNWSDYTPAGLQTLAERIGNLRNFDTVSGTKQSAILGQIYNKIAGSKGIIDVHYPELKILRENFSKNIKVFDEINNIIGGNAKTPIARQSAVTRLSNLFKEDKEIYLNAIKQLSDRSGTDILGMLAGTEFQKVLPDFVRGLGGGATVGVGASLLNPWLVLLAPLFSPRAVGKIVENAPKIAGATDKLIRSITSQLVGQGQK